MGGIVAPAWERDREGEESERKERRRSEGDPESKTTGDKVAVSLVAT